MIICQTDERNDWVEGVDKEFRRFVLLIEFVFTSERSQ